MAITPSQRILKFEARKDYELPTDTHGGRTTTLLSIGVLGVGRWRGVILLHHTGRDDAAPPQ
jgi:hypothetical protein